MKTLYYTLARNSLALLMSITLVMISGVNATATTHSHAYSFSQSQCYNSGYLSSHPYYDNGTYKTCEIWGYYYRDVYTCACGDSYYANYHIVERHTALCGQ